MIPITCYAQTADRRVANFSQFSSIKVYTIQLFEKPLALLPANSSDKKRKRERERESYHVRSNSRSIAFFSDVCLSTLCLMPYHPAVYPSSSLSPPLAQLPPCGSLHEASCQTIAWLFAQFTLYTHLEPSWTLPERTKNLSFLKGPLPSLLKAIVSQSSVLCSLQLFICQAPWLGDGYKVV